MDKKEIYEHLANIYLDASSGTKKKKKRKKYPPVLKSIFLSAVIVVFTISLYHLSQFSKTSALKSTQVALILQSDATKMNFNFDPAKKEIFSLGLNKLDITGFRRLAFSARKTNPHDTITLRVEFNNRFQEKSSIYFRDIPCKWKDYSVNLSEFKNISHWNEMNNLAFIVEEWNVREKKGIVYIDNIRLLR